MKQRFRFFIWFSFFICLLILFTGCLKASFFYTSANLTAKSVWKYSDKEKYLSEWYLYRLLQESFSEDNSDIRTGVHSVSKKNPLPNGVQEVDERENTSVKTTSDVSVKDEHTVCSYYYYEGLSEKLQEGYIAIYNGLSVMETEIEIPDLTSDEIRQVLDAVLYDHPEIFWLSSENIMFSNTEDNHLLIVTYVASRDQVQTMQKNIYDVAWTCWSDVDTKKMSNEEKVKQAHDWLLDFVSYDLGQTKDAFREKQNIDSTFLDRKTVCTGYAKGLKYLLDMVDCPCILVSGNGVQEDKKESHVWNIVKCGDAYYNIDVTWDDIYEGNKQLQNLDDFHFYTYFLCDDLMFSQTHVPDDTSGKLPKCNDPNAYYYRKNGHYLNTDDVDVIGELFTNDILNGNSWSAILCEDDGIYKSVLKNTDDIVSRLGDLNWDEKTEISYVAIDSLRLIVYQWK